MRKALLSGMILACIAAAAASAVMNDGAILLLLSGAVSIASITISGIMYGVFISGEQNRANFHTESKNDRSKRQKIGTYCLLFGIPSMIALLGYYLISAE